MSAHISSFIILCLPEKRHTVAHAAACLPGVEIYRCSDDGKIIALAEGGHETHIAETLQTLQDLPHVIAANMVYHGIDEDSSEQQ